MPNEKQLPKPGPAMLTIDGIERQVDIEWCRTEAVHAVVSGHPVDVGFELIGQFRVDPRNPRNPQNARLKTPSGETLDICLWTQRYFTANFDR